MQSASTFSTKYILSAKYRFPLCTSNYAHWTINVAPYTLHYALCTLHYIKDIKFKQFKNNISSIAVLGSYFIFNNRNIETWHTPSEFINAPMTNMWILYTNIMYSFRRETIPCLQEDLCDYTLTFLWGFWTSLLYFAF